MVPLSTPRICSTQIPCLLNLKEGTKNVGSNASLYCGCAYLYANHLISSSSNFNEGHVGLISTEMCDRLDSRQWQAILVGLKLDHKFACAMDF